MLQLRPIRLFSLRLAVAMACCFLLLADARAADDYASLLAAIIDANESGGVITLSDDIRLEVALPPITGEITIDGGGHSISGAGEFRHFDVAGGSLAIENVTLTDGRADEGGAIRIRDGAEVSIVLSSLADNAATTGGAISQSGDQDNRLTIESSSFVNNRADWYAGALDVVRGSVDIASSSFLENYADDYGGALISHSSQIRISNSVFYKNSAKHDGGAVFAFGGDVELTHVTMLNNSLTNPYHESGRTIARQTRGSSQGAVSIYNSIVAGRGNGEDCFGGVDNLSGNLSRDGTCAYESSDRHGLGELTGSPARLPLLDTSPAIDAADPQYCLKRDQIGTARPQGSGCDIGAIESTTALRTSTATPTVCTLHDQIVAANTNRAYNACPAGSGADTIYLDSDITLSESLAVIKSDITIEGNGHTINGNRRVRIFDVDGGKLTLNNVTLSEGKSTKAGGAIRLQNGGQAIVSDSRFIGNYAHSGGAIGSRFAAYIQVSDSIFEGNWASNSGGVISMNGGGSANISNSSFVGNFSLYEGGAISSISGYLSVSNSTFIGNSARRHGGALAAGGALASGSVPMTLTHVTILDNTAARGGALYVEDSGFTRVALRLRNSVIAGAEAAAGKRCAAKLSQNINNLIDDGSCSPMLSGDPMLEPADESTTTAAPRAGSPAIDAANADVCLKVDQLGATRPLGYGCDIGAIEVMPAVSPLSNCRVTPSHNLNFRAGPWGEVIGLAHYTTTFTARARTPNWFQVDDEAGARTGWIYADYTRAEGDCD